LPIISKQRDERLCLTFTRGTTHIPEHPTPHWPVKFVLNRCARSPHQSFIPLYV